MNKICIDFRFQLYIRFADKINSTVLELFEFLTLIYDINRIVKLHVSQLSVVFFESFRH